MKRQVIIVSIIELKKLIKQLEEENKDFEKRFGIKMKNKKWIIGIINKEGLSDTWRIEF
jgi:hypothetical protein